MIKVIYIDTKDDRFERKGNVAYFFKDVENEHIYKWSTSGNNHYGIYKGKEYLIKFNSTDEVEDNATRIKNVEIFETLSDGTIRQKTNKKGTYKEWM